MADFLLIATLVMYAGALVAALVSPRVAAYLLGFGVSVHVGAMVGRGIAIEYLPLTNKLESFSAASLGVAVALLVTYRPHRGYIVLLLSLVIAPLAIALFVFPWAVHFPPPLMRTVWYPLHVPLSFLSYGLWSAAAVAGICWFFGRRDEWIALVDRLMLQGFAVWTLSMICGGFWGVVAWGAYFMWDAKIIWSVILWFHYGSAIHANRTPSLARLGFVRPLLAVVGFVFVIVAYIGTSFFFGRSSHGF